MKNIEIERRFLLKNHTLPDNIGAPQFIAQGYLSVDKERTVRVRISGGRAFLTLKSFISDISRHEFEYEIPTADAQTVMAQMCPFKVEKNRYTVRHAGFVFEIDEYFGDNAPLITAEIELPSEDTPFARPDWLGEEITADSRYTNAYLSRCPYSAWAR